MQSLNFITFCLGVGACLPLSRHLTKTLRKFTLRHVYNDRKSESLAESRSSKWKKMKKKSTQHLPPDQDSHDLRALRVTTNAMFIAAMQERTLHRHRAIMDGP